MNAQMIMPIASLLLIRSLDTEDPSVQQNIQYAFVATQTAVVLFGIVFYLRVRASRDNTVVDVPPVKVPFQAEDQQAPWRKMRASDYDMEQLSELYLKRILMTLAIVSFLSWKWGHMVPMLFQCIHNPLQIYQSQLFKIYFLGKEAKDDLARPFPQPNPFGFMGAMNQPQQPEARRR
jgi:hypothetical protein